MSLNVSNNLSDQKLDQKGLNLMDKKGGPSRSLSHFSNLYRSTSALYSELWKEIVWTSRRELLLRGDLKLNWCV
jgi:hypothetical protein